MAARTAIFLMAVAASVSAVFNERELVFGKKLEGKVFHTVTGVSASQCWEECENRPACASFNYIRRFHICELNSPKTEDAVLVNAAEYVYKEMQQSDTCDSGTCNKGDTCDSNTACSVTECPQLPVPLNGYKKGNMNNIGSKVVLGCKDECYDPDVTGNITCSVVSECRANETSAFWSVQPFNCSVHMARFNNSCILFKIEKKTFEEARKSCLTLNGNLVEIETKEKQTFLTHQISDDYFWIGASDAEEEGDWKWVTSNTSVTYTSWHKSGGSDDKDEPNGNGNENHAVLYKSEWYDFNGELTRLGFICEIPVATVDST